LKRFFITGLILVVAAFLVSCQKVKPVGPVRIAISKAVPEESYQNYLRWIKSVDTTIVCFDLYHLTLDSALALLDQCDGLLLTGGPDVFPGRYGKESEILRCLEIDFKRDSLEIALLERAFEKKMPVQGVCRGLQLINVYLGGSLIIDIPADLDTLITHQLPDTYECYHDVAITKGSALSEISGTEFGISNSNHHQGVDVLAHELTGTATTGDGLIEAVGFKNSYDKSYLMAVQWHPERLEYTNPLSGPLVKKFVESVKTYHHSVK